jgi:hypothetical protein
MAKRTLVFDNNGMRAHFRLSLPQETVWIVPLEKWIRSLTWAEQRPQEQAMPIASEL